MAETVIQTAPKIMLPPPAWKKSLGAGARTTASIVGLLFVWFVIGSLPWTIAIPSPIASLQAFLQLNPVNVAIDILLSCRRVALGFIIATLTAVPLGIIAGYSRWVRELTFPIIEVLRPVPPIAWIPLAILFFPTSESMVVFLTFLGAFFPIIYNTIAGFSSIKPMYLRSGKSLGAGEWRLFWHVILPGMLPVVFAGLQIAVGISWLMVVAGEMMAAKGGIGAFTWEAYQTGRYPLIFVGMAIIGTLGSLSSLLIRTLGSGICRWEAR
ncbi:MAG TPA: ABC transporter permease [Xanthobacteraceae bacterium]|nr:ABC transporter permease [Xanthobacteraceae bacterium]